MSDPIDRKVAFTLAEAGERTGLSPSTLRAQIKRGVIPATLMGKTYIVRADDLEGYLRDHAGKPGRSAKGERGTLHEAEARMTRRASAGFWSDANPRVIRDTQAYRIAGYETFAAYCDAPRGFSPAYLETLLQLPRVPLAMRKSRTAK